MTEPNSLDDQNFIKQFEELTLDPAYFDHRGHLRIAWLYLSQNLSLQSIDKICLGIKRYASHLGASDKYHHSLSYTLVLIIAKRIAQAPTENLSDFIDNNPELTSSTLELVQACFSFDLLSHPTAKTQLIKPDIGPLIDFQL